MRKGWLIYKMGRFFVIFLVLCWLLLSACQPQVETRNLNGATMGTTWSVTLHSLPDGFDLAKLKSQLQAQLDRINRLMSTYDPESEISRFNAQTSDGWFALSRETAQVIELSQQISELTGGSFDVSVGPLVELWGFGAKQRGDEIPSPEQVKEQLAKVGYQKLLFRRDPAAIKKLVPQLQVDLSAIAKGYAVDALAALLKQQGINNFLVEIGGEMQLVGQRSDGTPWRIAIEKPLENERAVETVFPLNATAVATSGNYRNFYIENGQRYAHTLDPLSGRPIRHKLASVTVLDPSCARADALATALMVLGEEKGRQLCEKHQIAAFFVIHNKEEFVEYASPAFQNFTEKKKK
ncbi:MAG: FAD:protein FMN transferase [Deltaproteobacteria bacterium]|jgi:thiamine biosynthesis lipoprotein|nr:FAD:protein FMN transferase [Deltaproteobacteria bacterium]MCW8892261.1 FAD:protein FMN transferase [Deltaproteobacteria bacterium]MCW9049676.1 FAD:protein FMN transferase [Deltaproteobacteria bacterium]